MRIPPSAPPRAPAAPAIPPAIPPARPASPAAVARLVALEAQRAGIALLLGARTPDAAEGAPGTLAVPGATPARPAQSASPIEPVPGADPRVVAAGGAAGDPSPVGPLATAARIATASELPTEALAASSRIAEAALRLDPAAWVPALHLPLVVRLHARHPSHAAGLPRPAHPATPSQLRALGRWLAERSEVATGDEELVRLARALRLDRRLVRVAAATLLLAALTFALR